MFLFIFPFETDDAAGTAFAMLPRRRHPNENVNKQFKTNHNISKILSCIENANINNQWKWQVYTFICFTITPKTKIDFLENRFYVKIPVFP